MEETQVAEPSRIRKPVLPKSAYIWFVRAVMEEYTRKKPNCQLNLKMYHFHTYCEPRWEILDFIVKRPFYVMEQEDKERHHHEMKEYEQQKEENIQKTEQKFGRSTMSLRFGSDDKEMQSYTHFFM